MHKQELAERLATRAAERSEFLRMDAVRKRTGLGRSTIYRLIAARNFPPPVRLSGRAVGWRTSDLDKWSAALLPAAH